MTTFVAIQVKCSFTRPFIPKLEYKSVVPELTTRSSEHFWWPLLLTLAWPWTHSNDGVMAYKHFPHYSPLMLRIQPSPVTLVSPKMVFMHCTIHHSNSCAYPVFIISIWQRVYAYRHTPTIIVFHSRLKKILNAFSWAFCFYGGNFPTHCFLQQYIFNIHV